MTKRVGVKEKQPQQSWFCWLWAKEKVLSDKLLILFSVSTEPEAKKNNDNNWMIFQFHKEMPHIPAAVKSRDKFQLEIYIFHLISLAGCITFWCFTWWTDELRCIAGSIWIQFSNMQFTKDTYVPPNNEVIPLISQVCLAMKYIMVIHFYCQLSYLGGRNTLYRIKKLQIYLLAIKWCLALCQIWIWMLCHDYSCHVLGEYSIFI